MLKLTSFSNYRNAYQERLVKIELLENGTIKTVIDCIGDYKKRTISYWNKSKYGDYPMAFMKDINVPLEALDELRDYAKRFTLAYFEAVGEVKSPKQFKEYDSSSYVYEHKEDKESLPSGVPPWMLETCKVWVECFNRTGPDAGKTAYFRRARFDEQKRDTVEKYLTHCQSCPFRVDCNKPCNDPEVKSITKL